MLSGWKMENGWEFARDAGASSLNLNCGIPALLIFCAPELQNSGQFVIAVSTISKSAARTDGVQLGGDLEAH